jgi:hypothetical protein
MTGLHTLARASAADRQSTVRVLWSLGLTPLLAATGSPLLPTLTPLATGQVM